MTKLKIIKRSAVRYFSIFLFEIQRVFIRKCSTFIYNSQALPGSLKISNLLFLANPVYRVRSHPSALHLKTFQWHGWTRSSNNSIFLFEIYQFLVGKYSTFIYNPQALQESEKNANVICFADLVHRVRRDPSVTLRKFSPDTTGHGLRITKRPAVWYFSIFLFKKYQFLLEIFYLYLESSSASRKGTNLNFVLFADSVHRVRRDPSVTQFSSDSSRQNSKYCKETVKWRTANEFTVKQFTIRLGCLEKDDFRRFSVIWEFRVTGK